MMAVGHMLAGAIGGNMLLNLSDLSLGACIIGTIAPDIDNPRSVLGRILFFVSWPLSLLGHRTITHSLVGAALFGLLVYIIQTYTGTAILIPFLFGYISHLLLDILSGGIQLLYPYPQFVGIDIIKTGGMSELFVTVILICAVFVI